MVDSKARGTFARRAVPASVAVALALALVMPQAGFSGEASDEVVLPQTSKTVPMQEESDEERVPQVSQQVPLDVEAPQLVGVAPLDSEGEARQEGDALSDGSTEGSASEAPGAEAERTVRVTFRIVDEATASWPDAPNKDEATVERTVEVEAGQPLGGLAPIAPVSSDDALAFESWQTEDFAHEYTVDELQDATFQTDTVLYAQFGAAPQDAAVDARATTGWTKFGTCEWQINAAGTLIIRPENNGTSGTLSYTQPSSKAPWLSQASEIKSAIVQSGVKATYVQEGLFLDCANMVSLTITESLGTDVVSVANMCKGCSSLTSLTLPVSLGLYISDVSGMFEGCSSLSSVTLLQGFVPSVNKTADMFSGCSSLTSLEIPLDFGANIEEASGMFDGCSNLVSLSLPTGFCSESKNTYEIFKDCASLRTLVVPEGFGAQDDWFDSMFSGCNSLASLELPAGFGSNATSMNYMFENCSSLASLEMPDGFGSKATSMLMMFSGCSNLRSLSLPTGFGVISNDMSNMFEGCSSLVSMSLPDGFGVHSQYLSSIFKGCLKLSTLTLPEGFASEAFGMGEMFYDCVSLTKIPANFTFNQTAYTGQCFYLEAYDSPDPLPTYYSGSDPAVYSYDWESDGRVLNPSLSGSVVVEGDAYANQTLTAIATLPQLASPAYQWCTADTPEGPKTHIQGATTNVLDLSKLDPSTIVGKLVMCEVADAAGWYKDPIYSDPTSTVGIANGVSGECVWTIDCEGSFVLFSDDGNTAVLDDLSAGSIPWSRWATDITSAKVEPDVQAGESVDSMFAGCSNLVSVEVSRGFDWRNNIETAANMFAGCEKLTQVDLSTNFQNAVLTSMFQGCASLTSLSFADGFGGSGDLSSMFKNCSSLASITLPEGFGEWATNVSSMFEGCSSLTALVLPKNFAEGDWRIEGDASCLFKGCSALVSVSFSGDTGWYMTNMSSMFQDCSKMKSLSLPDYFGRETKDVSSMFRGCSSLSELTVSADFGGDATDTSSMFEGCSSIASDGFASGFKNFGWDIASGSRMFRGCSSLKSFDARTFFSNSMPDDSSFMFEGCSALKTVAMTEGDYYDVLNMQGMFKGCSSLSEVSLSSDFGSSVVNTSEMFSGCSNLASFAQPQNFNYYDSLTDMQGMFRDCTSLSSLTLSDKFTSSATNMSSLFANCPQLAKIPDGFTFGLTDEASRKGCFALGDPYNASNLRPTFYAGSDSRVTSYGWTADNRVLNPPLTGSVTVSGSLYANQTLVATAASLPSGVTPAFQWYAAATPDGTKAKIDGATSASLNLALVDSSKVVGKRLFCEVTDAGGMYSSSLWSAATGIVNVACGTSGAQTGGCVWAIDYQGAFTLAPAAGPSGTLGEMAWNNVPWATWATKITTAKVSAGVIAGKSLQSLFSGCSAMTALDVSGLSTPQPADMLSMLSGCLSLKQVSGLDGLKSSRTEQMFMGCCALAGIGLAGFDTSQATAMTGMFSGCSGLASLDLSMLSTAKAVDMGSLFKGCSSLSTLTLPDGFVGSACTSVASMFEGCASLATIPANFAFGPAGAAVATDRCFFVGDPYSSTNLLSTAYLGDDERVAAYGWASSNRKLADWNLKGDVTLSVPGDVWNQGRKATASVKFKPPATGLQPSYQWRRSAHADGSQAVDIAGATTAEYVPVADDVGSYLVCAASAPGSGARGEVAAVSPQPVAAAQVSVTVPNVTSVAISSTGKVSVPDASVYALGNPSGEGGSTGAIRLKSVRLTLHESAYPGGAWTLGTKADPDAYLPAATFAIGSGNAYDVAGAPSVAVGGTMPLQWAADLAGSGVGPQFARLLADAQGPEGAAYGSVVFTVEYASEG